MGRGGVQRIDSGIVRQSAMSVLDDLVRQGEPEVTMHYLLDRIQEDLNLRHAGRWNRVGGRSKDLRNRIGRQVAQIVDAHIEWTRGRRLKEFKAIKILPNGRAVPYYAKRQVNMVWMVA